CVNGGDLVVGKNEIEEFKVLLLTPRISRPWHHDASLLDMPAQHNLVFSFTVALCGIAQHRKFLQVQITAGGRISTNHNVVFSIGRQVIRLAGYWVNLDLVEGNLKSRIRYCLKVGGFEIGHAPGANQPGIDEFYQRGTRLYVIAQLRIWPVNQHQIKVLETGFAKAVFDPGTHGCNVTKICIDQFRGHKQFVAWY